MKKCISDLVSAQCQQTLAFLSLLAGSCVLICVCVCVVRVQFSIRDSTFPSCIVSYGSRESLLSFRTKGILKCTRIVFDVPLENTRWSHKKVNTSLNQLLLEISPSSSAKHGVKVCFFPPLLFMSVFFDFFTFRFAKKKKKKEKKRKVNYLQTELHIL